MNSGPFDLRETLSSWVSATTGTRIPVPSTEKTRHALERIRPLLRNSPFDVASLDAGEDILAVLSLLGSDLLVETESSRDALAEAAGAFSLLSGVNNQGDEYGEVAELQCRFAFIAWRHARVLRSVRASQYWLGQFEECFSRESVFRECFEYFLLTPFGDNPVGLSSTFLSDSEDLFSLCALLRQVRNERPAPLATRLPYVRSWIESRFWPSAFPDERDYFLGQVELSAGACSRWLGERSRAESSYDQAARLFTKTVEPETGNAEVECCRLVIRYDESRFDHVLASLPELQSRLEALGMASPLVHSKILLSATLKNVGRLAESNRILEDLLSSDELRGKDGIKAFALEGLGDGYAMLGRIDESVRNFQSALLILNRKEVPTARAFLKLALGGVFLIQGQADQALDAYQEARGDYDDLGLATWSSYARLLGAEALLALGREREAESEILETLPTIEALGLMREGLAAIALLRESVRRRNTDRNALRDLREHLQRGR